MVDRTKNARNKRTTRMLEFQGEQISFMDFWETYCPGWKSYNSLSFHLSSGKSPEEIALQYLLS
ncbi:MAG: hypothetical protein HQL78_13130 [Magnetococcales bacterium]|nr:hypothetical protein [Magnetococcales bacterium]